MDQDPRRPRPGSTESGPFGEPSRRTWLAQERTLLAWIRSALTAFAVAVAVGGVVPELAQVDSWPFAVVGVGYALLGIAMALYGFRRSSAVEESLRSGDYAKAGGPALAAIGSATVILGLATILLVVLAA